MKRPIKPDILISFENGEGYDYLDELSLNYFDEEVINCAVVKKDYI